MTSPSTIQYNFDKRIIVGVIFYAKMANNVVFCLLNIISN